MRRICAVQNWDGESSAARNSNLEIELIKTIWSSHQHTVRATLCGTYESAEFSLLTKLKGNSTQQVDWNCSSTLEEDDILWRNLETGEFILEKCRNSWVWEKALKAQLQKLLHSKYYGVKFVEMWLAACKKCLAVFGRFPSSISNQYNFIASAHEGLEAVVCNVS